jgi:hypothetical protein
MTHASMIGSSLAVGSLMVIVACLADLPHTAPVRGRMTRHDRVETMIEPAPPTRSDGDSPIRGSRSPVWSQITASWHGVNVLVTGASLIVQTWLVLVGSTDVNSGASTAASPLSTRLVNLFSYFTIQSNILVLIAAIRLLIDPSLSAGPTARRRTGWQVVRLTGLLGIFVTGVVYVIVLRPLSHPTGIYAAVNAGLHYVTPLLAVLGWLLLGPRPRIGWRVFWSALIWPIAWLVYTMIRGAITGWYPYPFLEVPTIGVGATARNLAVITIMAILVLLIMKAADRLPSLGGSGRHSVDADSVESIEPPGESR